MSLNVSIRNVRRSTLVLGTRGSKLALCQSEWFQAKVQEVAPDVQVVLKKIQTSGDRIVDVPLAKIGGKACSSKKLRTRCSPVRLISPFTA